MVFPKNNLPSEAKYWVREVEKKVTNLENNLSSSDINNTTRDSQLQVTASQALIAAQAAEAAANDASIAADAANNALLGLGSLDEATSTYKINASNVTVGTLSGDRITGGTIDGVTITGGSLNTSPSSGKNVQISGSSASFNYNGSPVGQIAADNIGRLLISGDSGLYMGGWAAGTTHFGTGGFTVGDGANLTVQGTALINGSLTRTILAGGGTTTASINNTGNFIRTSSSQRYKTDIQLLDIDLNDLYAVEPKTFKRIDEVEDSPETARTYPGFIAEDLAGTSLDKFVFYSNDEQGNPRPEGIHYAELTGALLIAIKDLNARIEALETK